MPNQREQFESRYAQIAKSDRAGWSDDYEAAIERYRSLLAKAEVSGGRLLEPGCGRGNIALALAQGGFEVTGIDFSPTAIEWAKGLELETKLLSSTPSIRPTVSSCLNEWTHRSLSPEGDMAAEVGQSATFEVADLAQSWPFGDRSFDVVIDANCLHFFHGEGRVHFLAEARRVLRSGGAFLLSTIVNQPEEKDWEFLGYDSSTRTSTQNGVTMNYYTTVPELLGALEGAGFEVIYSEITNVDNELMWLVAK